MVTNGILQFSYHTVFFYNSLVISFYRFICKIIANSVDAVAFEEVLRKLYNDAIQYEQ